MFVEYRQTFLRLKLFIVILLFPSLTVAEIGPALSCLTASANDATSPVKDDKRTVALPLDRVIGGGVGYEMPFLGYLCRVNLNYFDLGNGDVSQEGGPLTGDFEGSFDKHWVVMLDLQFRKIF